jgi:hypothetical protein
MTRSQRFVQRLCRILHTTMSGIQDFSNQIPFFISQQQNMWETTVSKQQEKKIKMERKDDSYHTSNIVTSVLYIQMLSSCISLLLCKHPLEQLPQPAQTPVSKAKCCTVAEDIWNDQPGWPISKGGQTAILVHWSAAKRTTEMLAD